MTRLAEKACVACTGAVPPLKGVELGEYVRQLGGEWEVIREQHLDKTFHFKNFREALEFTNRVGEVAEKEQHHPDIYLSWGKVKVTIWTHKVDGLTENDFILAAKVDLAHKR